MADAKGMRDCATLPFPYSSGYLNTIGPVATTVNSPIRILIVEDHAETAEWVEACLGAGAPDQFSCYRAANLSEAIQRVARQDVDVVLLDLSLPELSGPRTYCVLQASCGETPVVVFTADTRDSSRGLLCSMGAADYLVKQESSPQVLRAALRNAAHGSSTWGD